MDLRTPLYELHEKASGKIVPFAGYLLPVQYPTGIIAEHTAVRTAAGLFDVSHMGEITLEGEDALENIQALLTNDYSDLQIGFVRYSPMCNEQGGVVDDLIVYRKGESLYYIVVNAANHDKDVAWIKSRLFGKVLFTDCSGVTAEIALQGPSAKDILKTLCDESLIPVKYYSFTDNADVDGINCLLSRTGYTGEDGFELYCDSKDAPALWEKLLTAGKDFGLIPCGLGSRDTLRLEAAMPLYGHEMTDDITPLETGLGRFVKLGKSDFCGKSALIEKGEPTRTRVGLEILDRGIARGGEPVFSGEKQVGFITSGTMAPYLKKSIAMAIVDISAAAEGTELTVEIRGKRLRAQTGRLP
ncbi:MAG: glycine cleavage system aminomethyltransferase GcvT, partial [Clostridiales bacterium]|nr:glycine cleavage system aminomethyltransferase GcvT [Clostridiales bacterium]